MSRNAFPAIERDYIDGLGHSDVERTERQESSEAARAALIAVVDDLTEKLAGAQREIARLEEEIKRGGAAHVGSGG